MNGFTFVQSTIPGDPSLLQTPNKLHQASALEERVRQQSPSIKEAVHQTGQQISWLVDMGQQEVHENINSVRLQTPQ